MGVAATTRQGARSGKQPDEPRQAQLPFGAAEGEHQNNLALIQQLFDHCGKTHGIKSKHIDLLHWIEDFHSRNGDPLRKTLRELGQRRVRGFGLGCSEDTVQRIVDRLESLGIIIVDRGSNGDRGRRENWYSIHWPTVVRIIQEARTPSLRTPAAQRDFANPQNAFRKPAFCGSQTRNLRNANPQNADQRPLSLYPEISPNRTVSEKEPFNSVRSGAVREDVFELDHAEWPEVCEEAKRVIAVLGPHLERENRGQDRELVFKVAWLRHLRQLPEEVTAEALRVVKSGRMQGEPIRNRWGAYRGVIIRRCRAYQIDFHQLLDRVPIPPWAEGIVR